MLTSFIVIPHMLCPNVVISPFFVTFRQFSGNLRPVGKHKKILKCIPVPPYLLFMTSSHIYFVQIYYILHIFPQNEDPLTIRFFLSWRCQWRTCRMRPSCLSRPWRSVTNTWACPIKDFLMSVGSSLNAWMATTPKITESMRIKRLLKVKRNIWRKKQIWILE